MKNIFFMIFSLSPSLSLSFFLFSCRDMNLKFFVILKYIYIWTDKFVFVDFLASSIHIHATSLLIIDNSSIFFFGSFIIVFCKKFFRPREIPRIDRLHWYSLDNISCVVWFSTKLKYFKDNQKSQKIDGSRSLRT